MSTRGWLATVGALAAISLAACGDDDEETAATAETGTTGTEAEATQPSGEASERVAVSETEYELDPADPTIKKPGTVEFEATNDGEIVHSLEVEGPTEEAVTEDIDPGDSAKLEVDLSEPGEYEWYCPIGNHRELGMEGTVTVEG